MPVPHEILGVPADATHDRIVAAYRDLVIEVHPDQGGSTAEFRRVRQAYLDLTNGSAPADTDTAAGTVGTESAGSSRTSQSSGAGAGASERASAEPVHRVEYLNYDVLADYGWDLTDEDLFAKATEADLGPRDLGAFVVDDENSLLQAAEAQGFAWPFACRGGACSNCAVALIEGEMPPPVSHVLPPELIDRGIRLSCISTPVTTNTKVVYNVKHVPGVEELLLPASRFEQAHTDD